LFTLRSQCSWCVQHDEGIIVDPTKVEAIMKWNVSKSFSELCSFMALSVYYQGFVEGFSKISNLIMELQKKKNKFLWTKNCMEAFRRLKELLMTTPILKFLHMGDNFLVCSNAS
jgi:hypothetical protein